MKILIIILFLSACAAPVPVHQPCVRELVITAQTRSVLDHRYVADVRPIAQLCVLGTS